MISLNVSPVGYGTEFADDYDLLNSYSVVSFCKDFFHFIAAVLGT